MKSVFNIKTYIVLLFLVLLSTNLFMITKNDFINKNASVDLTIDLSTIQLSKKANNQLLKVRRILNDYDKNGKIEIYDLGWIGNIIQVRKKFFEQLNDSHNVDIFNSSGAEHKLTINSYLKDGKVHIKLAKLEDIDALEIYLSDVITLTSKTMASELQRIVEMQSMRNKVAYIELTKRFGNIVDSKYSIYKYRYTKLGNFTVKEINAFELPKFDDIKTVQSHRTAWYFLLTNSAIVLSFLLFFILLRKLDVF